MNLKLKKTKRAPRVALGDLPQEKKSRKVSSLEQEPIKELPTIRLDNHLGEPQESEQAQEWYEQIESLADAPNDETYRQLSVADFGAALRRGMGISEPESEPTEMLKSHDYTGIGFNSKQS